MVSEEEIAVHESPVGAKATAVTILCGDHERMVIIICVIAYFPP